MNQKKQVLCRPERGVVLTEEGLYRLEEAIKAWWEQEPLENKVRYRKLAQEAIAERLNFNIKTVRRIRSRQPVDRATLRAAFDTMNLTWHEGYGIHAALCQRVQDLRIGPTDAQAGHSPSLSNIRASGHTHPFWPHFPLVGRDEELELVMQTLGVSRLVTLTGGGGVGKSRLAQAVETVWAAQCHPYLTCWVDLAVDTPLPWVSATLLTEAQEPDSPATLARSIRDCSLLVLDNGDQAKSLYAPSLRNLLRLCPNLRVLVTSRRALGIPGEIPIPLLPLRVPTPIEAQSCSRRVDLLTQFASVQLFIQVLKTLQPGFEMTEENAGEVASICYSQDGVPRSLEFAAAVMAHCCYPIDKPDSTLLIQGEERTSNSLFEAP